MTEQWQFTRRCERMMDLLSIDRQLVLWTVSNWRSQYRTDPESGYRGPTVVRQAGMLAVVVNPACRAIITVAKRTPELWDRQVHQ